MGDIAVILVHGIFSSKKTWSDIATRISEDPDLQPLCDIFYIEYSTPKIRLHPLRRIPDYNAVADNLKNRMDVDIAQYSKVVMISHSQGGLIVQRYLARMINAGRGLDLARVRAVILLACPNEGSQLLLSVRTNAFFWRHAQERQLRPLNRDVLEARHTVLRAVQNATHCDAYHCHIPIYAYGGTTDNVVSTESAKGIFEHWATLPGDHSSIIHAPTADSETFKSIKNHLLRVERSDTADTSSDLDIKEHQPSVARISDHNVSPPTSTFFNRFDEIQRTIEGLKSAYRVVSISGLGGMGKTALANRVAWAYIDAEVTAPNFEYVAWAGGPGGLPGIDSLIDSLSLVIGYPYLRALPMPEKLDRAVYHLNHQRCLLVLDNFDQTRDHALQDLIARVNPAWSKVLITSRYRYPGEAWSIDLSGLGVEARHDLLTEEGRRLGISEVLDSEQPLVTEYLEATGGNPLAIRLTTSHIRNHGSDLRSTTTNLLSARENALFESIFDDIWHDRLSTDERLWTMLMTIALHTGSASRGAVRHVLGIRDVEFNAVVKDAVETSLVDMRYSGPDKHARLQLHPLTRAYTLRKLAGSVAIRRTIESKLIDFYLTFARTNADIYTQPVNASVLDVERGNIGAFADLAHQRATETGDRAQLRQVIDFADAMLDFLFSRGLWRERLRLSNHAATAAAALADTVTEARHFALMGRVHVWLGNDNDALEMLRRSEQTLPKDADDADRRETLRLRGHLALRAGDYSIAEALFARVLTVAAQTADNEGRAATLIELGTCSLHRGDFEVARDRFEQARRLDMSMDAVEGEAIALSYLGNVFYESGDHRSARAQFEQGLVLARRAGRLSSEGRCLIGSAKLDIAAKRFAEAKARVRHAEEIFDRLGMAEMRPEVELILDNLHESDAEITADRTGIAGLIRGCRAVIFDFDDTIAATAKSRWAIMRRTAASFGETLTEDTLRRAWGKKFNELIHEVVPNIDADQFFAAYSEAMKSEQPIPTIGARLLVTSLRRRGVRQVIVGSGSYQLTVQDLDQIGITECFENIYCADQQTVSKPDPQVLSAPLRALERTGIDRNSVIYVGDSTRDLEAARGNGLNFIAVTTGLETREDFVSEGLPARLITPNLSLLQMWL